MSVFAERKNGELTGSLIVEVRVEGKVVRRRAKTKREAAKLEAQLKAGLVEQSKAATKPLTVTEMVQQVATLWHGHKDETNSLRRLHKAYELIGGDTLVRDITSASLDTLQASLRDQGLSDATINRYNAVVSRSLEWAVERDHLVKMPRIQWFTEPRRKFSWLEPEDEARVVQWLLDPKNVRNGAGPKVALVVQILTLTGLRVGELAALQVDHISVDGETVTAWDTKTRDSRTQWLPRHLADPLKTLKIAGTFPHYSVIKKVFYRARDALKLDPKLTIHGLRHTTATRLAGQGVNQKIIMDYMGHRSMHTTNRYTHVNASAKKGAAQVLMGLTTGGEYANS